MARPKKKLDVEKIERLAKAQCSNVQIAAAVGCDEGTIRHRFSEDVARWRDAGKTEVLVAMFEAAVKEKIPAILKHWSKQYLGHSDRTRVELTGQLFDAEKAYKGNPAGLERALAIARELCNGNQSPPADSGGNGKGNGTGLGVSRPHPGSGNGDSHPSL